MKLSWGRLLLITACYMVILCVLAGMFLTAVKAPAPPPLRLPVFPRRAPNPCDIFPRPRGCDLLRTEVVVPKYHCVPAPNPPLWATWIK
jgi:hypothetical protein